MWVATGLERCDALTGLKYGGLVELAPPKGRTARWQS
jgi:hypothetical protein